MGASRSELRSKWGQDVRTEALEGDVDQIDVKLDAIQRTLTKLLWAVMGAVLTFGVASLTIWLQLGGKAR